MLNFICFNQTHFARLEWQPWRSGLDLKGWLQNHRGGGGENQIPDQMYPETKFQRQKYITIFIKDIMVHVGSIF